MPLVQADTKPALFVSCCCAAKFVVCRAPVFALGAGAAGASERGWKLISALPACLELGGTRVTRCHLLSRSLSPPRTRARGPTCLHQSDSQGMLRKGFRMPLGLSEPILRTLPSKSFIASTRVSEGVNWKSPTAQPIKNKPGIKAVHEVANPQAWGLPHASTELLCSKPGHCAPTSRKLHKGDAQGTRTSRTAAENCCRRQSRVFPSYVTSHGATLQTTRWKTSPRYRRERASTFPTHLCSKDQRRT